MNINDFEKLNILIISERLNKYEEIRTLIFTKNKIFQFMLEFGFPVLNEAKSGDCVFSTLCEDDLSKTIQLIEAGVNPADCKAVLQRSKKFYQSFTMSQFNKQIEGIEMIDSIINQFLTRKCVPF